MGNVRLQYIYRQEYIYVEIDREREKAKGMYGEEKCGSRKDTHDA